MYEVTRKSFDPKSVSEPQGSRAKNLPRSDGLSKLMAKVSTATSCMAVVKFMQNTQTRRKNMLPTPTKAEMKQRNAITSDPIIIQEFKDSILSFKGEKVNFKIHGKFKGRLSPTFEREKLCFRRSNGSSFT